ncbi:MAG: Alanine dehydrogenase, partial [uncultured Friedmanniella sp.]
GGRPARTAGGRAHPAACGGWPRRPHGRRLRRVRREGRRHRRRRLRHERGGDRPRHAGRGPAARQEHRAAAPGRPHLPGSPADRREQRVRGGEGVPRRRPRHRRGARAGGQGAHPGEQRPRPPDEAGLGAGGHLDRPGRLLRGLAADDARRADVPGPRLGLLLRGQHAGRGAAHVDLRADQRHHAVRPRARRPRLARRPAPRPGVGARPQHVRGPGDLRPGRRGARARRPAARRGAQL